MPKISCVILVFLMIIIITPASFCDSHFGKVLSQKQIYKSMQNVRNSRIKCGIFCMKEISKCIGFMLNENICQLVEDAEDINVQPREMWLLGKLNK